MIGRLALMLSLVAAACNPAAAEADPSELSEGGLEDWRFAASPATSVGVGVVRWQSTPTELNGYDADQQRVVRVIHDVTSKPNQALVRVGIEERGHRAAFTISIDQVEGERISRVLRRDATDPVGTQRLLQLLQADLAKATASVRRGVSTSTLRPLDVQLVDPESCDEYDRRNDVIKVSAVSGLQGGGQTVEYYTCWGEVKRTEPITCDEYGKRRDILKVTERESGNEYSSCWVK